MLVMINVALTPFRLPTLLVLSGMLLSRALRQALGQYYAGKRGTSCGPTSCGR